MAPCDLKTYVLITAAKNEEKYIEKTLRAVIDQTIQPLKWVIVDDGSTDGTLKILQDYAIAHGFIDLIQLGERGKTNFGSQVRAINRGCQSLRSMAYDFIGNLDADISFCSEYFEKILNRFALNKNLGLAGGFIYENSEGRFKNRKFNSTRSVAHAVHLFRRNCFEAIGGYIPAPFGGSDTIAEEMAKMKGWEVRAFPEFPVYHHRKTCGVEGVLRGGFRQGRMDFSIGNRLLFEILKCGSRWKASPMFVYAGLRLIGFLWATVHRDERIAPEDFLRYWRKEQFERLRGIFKVSEYRKE